MKEIKFTENRIELVYEVASPNQTDFPPVMAPQKARL